MIGADSRYRTATLHTVAGPDDITRQEMRPAFPRSRQISYTYYLVTGDDRVDTIAYDVYGKASLWWLIADANPEILDWMDLRRGQILRVPSA